MTKIFNDPSDFAAETFRRAEQGTNLMQSIRRRLPGCRLDM